MDKKSIFSLCIEACIFIIIISFMHSHFSRENETLTQNLIAYKNDLEEFLIFLQLSFNIFSIKNFSVS